MTETDDERSVTTRATSHEMTRAFASLLGHSDPAVRRAAEISIIEQFLQREKKAGDPRQLVAHVLNRAGELAGAGIALTRLVERAKVQLSRVELDATGLSDDVLARAIRASIPTAPGARAAEAPLSRPKNVHAVFAAMRIESGGEPGTEEFLERNAPVDHDAVRRLVELFGIESSDKTE